jgi:adenine-specific DNA-methyltransferase
MAPNPKPTTQVDAIRHAETRKNIPTNELRDFMADYEATPQVMRYPRDPSLDPQLVWKGKDEQDASDLTVDVAPIYIQEKIHPRAIIADLLATSQSDRDAQLDMFADFNGIADFEQRLDFYEHDQHWSNRMILGDSLVVMTSLAEKEGLKGKVQTIYLDPPYGIKFGSNWQVSTRKRDVKDGKAEDATRQPEQVRAFRDTWKLGIHSYLAYLRDRLTVARELLTETGSIFVQIGDENVHLVRSILDEVFGSENFVNQISFQKTGSIESNLLPSTVDYVLWYAKAKAMTKYRPLYQPRVVGKTSLDRYDMVLFEDGKTRRASQEEMQTDAFSDDAKRYQLAPLYSDGASSESHEFAFQGKIYFPRGGTHWKTPPAPGLTRLAFANRIEAMGSVIRYRRFVDDFPVIPIGDRWESMQIGVQRVYVVQTAASVIERCLLMTTDPGDLVLDPTCGSGTTAYVAEQWGRRWITVDTSRVAIALARTRLMAARYPYYLLASSPAGAKKEAEAAGEQKAGFLEKPAFSSVGNDIRKGFVYKRVPHITLKAIANNAEIDTIHARWQPELERLAGELNQLLGKHWAEWEIPREAGAAWPQEVTKLHAAWWQARRARQQQIDASIARSADTELLFDQPYEDNKAVRVAGPFTVESLSPHRILPADEDMDGQISAQEARQSQDFVSIILDNLAAAGIQNTVKGERIKFESLEPFAGLHIHAVGQYTDASGRTQRVAVHIGPEYGTVGPEAIKEASIEAVRGVPFDLLVVCGFAFDPHVNEEARRYGRLTVLPVRMNPDLAMGDELLKKTGAGNLFMVFGEPDIEIRKANDPQISQMTQIDSKSVKSAQSVDKLIVEIKGVDVYDPTTGEIRSSSTDDIACWFIDTDYNEESFFVRHAYFTGADEPYDKLKRALRAEVDETAWQSLYSTVSRPFAPPTTGKIAVKVINHYGDEVLKVYAVGEKGKT